MDFKLNNKNTISNQTSSQKSSQTSSQTMNKINLWLVVLLSIIVVLPLNLNAGVGGFFEWRIKKGHVMSRGLILTEEGQPIYSEYLSDGSLGSDVAVLDASLQDATVISGDAYRAAANFYTEFLTQYAETIARGAEIISAENYRSKEFITLDDEPIEASAKAQLLSHRIKSVLVRRKEQILIPQTDPALLQATINLDTIDDSIVNNTSIISVLIDKQGNVIHSSTNNIGLKSGFFKDEDTKGTPESSDDIHAPVIGIGVEVFPYLGGRTSTDKNGKFVVSYMLPPCPGFSFEYRTPITATLYFGVFNPKGKYRSVIYPQTMPGSDICFGYSAALGGTSLVEQGAKLAIQQIELTIQHPVIDYTFKVDTVMLLGQSFFSNLNATGERSPLPVDSTQYSYTAPDLTNIAYQEFDFDGDGEHDTARLGDVETQKDNNGKDIQVFTQNDKSGSLQGIYLSSGSGQPDAEENSLNQPDFVRLADKAPDFQHQGLLESISKDDFLDTDVLVFRESNGMLITAKEGLEEDADIAIETGGIGDDDLAYFSMMLRGPNSAVWDVFGRGFHNSYGTKGGYDFSAVQSDANINPALHQRKADHIRAHEVLRIVAINRKTGYIGTERTTAGAFMTLGVANTFAIMNMRPPNLKVIAEREYIVDKGLSKDDEKKYLIGYEGAALASDRIIKITTQWFDHDGSPLPEGLGDYGYTGRLAKIVGENTVGQAGGALANFSIKPGQHTEHVQISSQATQNEHYYVQVSGEPIDGNPTFDTQGAGNGPLQYRPKHYVPILTPILDEHLSWEQYLAYKKYKEENPDEKIDKPEPIYRWFYRPEFQFSLYAFEVDKILGENSNSTGQQIDIYQDKLPSISGSDDLIKVLYSLLEQEIAPLEFLGAGQELVLALGEEEVAITVGEGQQLIFNNLEHLSSLDVEDFLSMRLYSNNDAANILWEYAFEYLALDTQYVGYDDVAIDEITGETTYYVSADEPTFPMQSFLVGYANRDKEDKQPVSVKWGVDGSGQMINQSQEHKENGVFTADIKMPTTTGARASVTAQLTGSDTKTTFGEIVVLPGKPSSISLSHSGEVFIEGHKGKNIEVIVKDAHGNTVADGTSVSFAVDGYAVIQSSDDGTVNGKANAFIIGASMPDENAQLSVTAGDVSEILPFVVQPLVVSINDYPAQMEAQKSYPIKVTVTEPNGSPAVNVAVIFTTNAGKYRRGRVLTDASGEAIAELHSGFNSLENVILGARVGLIPGELATSKVKPNEDTYAQTAETLVIGDETTNGIYEYERFDGATLGLDYKTQAQVLLHGSPEVSQTLTLGSLAEPNLQPTAAYIMNQLDDEQAIDENQLHHGITQHVTLVEDNPTQTGKSFEFKKLAELSPSDEWESSKITVAQDERLKPQNSVGFRLDVKPQTTGGELFNFEGGVQSLNLNADGSLTYQVFTENGMASVSSSAAVSLNAWHTVAGKYKDGKLILEVNGVVSETQFAGKLEYSVTNRGLTIGENFTGRLSSVKLYNYDNAPLVTFSDGSTQTTQTFAADTYEDAVQVISHGQLNTQTEQATTYRIGLTANINTGDDAGKTQDYFIGVVSKAYYGQLASLYIDAAKPTGYPIVSMNAYQRSPLVPFMGVAHAGFVDWIADNAFDTLVSAIGFIIPYEEGIGLVKQVYYLATGDEDFDSLELTINALGVAGFIPILKPVLLPLTKALKVFLRPLKASNPKFIKAIGGVMGKVTDDLLSGKFDTIIQMAPFLIIAGEMLSDAEARQGLMVMVNSIASTDDMFAWMEYLNLPADGWEGDGEPPEVELSASVSVNEVEDGFSPFGLMMGKAYAAKKKLRPRINGKELGEMFSDINKQFKLSETPGLLSKVVSKIGQSIKNTDIAAMRRLVFNKKMLASSLALMGQRGSKNLTNLIKNGSNLRVSPLALIGIISYLESRMSAATCTDSCTLLKPNTHSKIRNQYALVLGDHLAGNTKYLGNREIGAAFHLAMIAVKHFEYEVSGKYPIMGVEGSRKVPIYQFSDNASKSSVSVLLEKQRFVDIVLESDTSDKEIWVETKSLTGPFKRTNWKKWHPSKSGKNQAANQRQFALDRIAATDNLIFGAKDEYYQAERFEWWLQGFKRTNKQKKVTQGYTNADISAVRKEIPKNPTSKELQASFGYTKAADAKTFKNNLNRNCYINVFSIKNWLKSASVKNILLEGIADELIAQFNTADIDPANIEVEDIQSCTL